MKHELDAYTNLSRRRFHPSRCLRNGSKHGPSLRRRSGPPSSWSENVRHSRLGMGELITSFHRVGAMSDPVGFPQVWREDSEESEVPY